MVPDGVEHRRAREALLDQPRDQQRGRAHRVFRLVLLGDVAKPVATSIDEVGRGLQAAHLGEGREPLGFLLGEARVVHLPRLAAAGGYRICVRHVAVDVRSEDRDEYAVFSLVGLVVGLLIIYGVLLFI